MRVGVGSVVDRPGTRRRTAVEHPCDSILLHAIGIRTAGIPGTLVRRPIPDATTVISVRRSRVRTRTWTKSEWTKSHADRAVERTRRRCLRELGHRVVKIPIRQKMIRGPITAGVKINHSGRDLVARIRVHIHPGIDGR